MRIAVFSDLHGNPYACRAVLQALRGRGADRLVAAGDLCLGGSDPAACVDLLAEAGVEALYGNTERYLLAPDQEPPDEHHRRNWAPIQAAAYWTLGRLSSAQLAWLSGLPFERRYAPTRQAGDDLLVVHANPCEVETQILPAPREQAQLWGVVRQPDDDPGLVGVLQGVTVRTLAFGHFHRVFLRGWRGLRLVDVAGCSLPGIDHDRRARYSLFTWSGRAWRVERYWVDYGAEQEIAALRASDMPARDFFIPYFG